MKFNRSTLALGISLFSLTLHALESRLDLSPQPYSSETQPAHLLATHHQPNLHKRAHYWTGKEEDTLVKLRDEGMSWAQVVEEFPERTYAALIKKYYNLKQDPSAPAKAKTRPWTPEEDERLLKLSERKQEKTWEEIARDFPGRTASGLAGRIRRLRVENIIPAERKYPFTQEEDELLLQLAAKKMSWKERAKRFPNRNLTTLHARYRLLTPLEKSLRRPWTPGDEARLIEAVELGMSWEEIGELLDREPGAVKGRASILAKSGRINSSPLKYRKYTEADFDLMREKREEGMSWPDIARQHFPGRSLVSPSDAYSTYVRKKRRKGEAE